MTDVRDPFLQGRRLRAALREARRRAALTQKEVALSLEWSPSKILRIESGDCSISTPDLKTLLHRYGITDRVVIDDLVAMARASRRRRWTDFRDVINKDFRAYLGLEEAASTIRFFAATAIPGLLQTEGYMRAVIRITSDKGMSHEDVDRHVQLRLARQEALQRDDPPEVHVILDEGAIRRRVAPGTSVMTEQLEHLAKAVGQPRTTVQVLPFVAGEHPGMAGSFTYLELPGPEDADVVYLERGRDELLTRDTAHHTRRYLELFKALEDLALPRTESARLIVDVIAQMRAS